MYDRDFKVNFVFACPTNFSENEPYDKRKTTFKTKWLLNTFISIHPTYYIVIV